MKPYTETLKDIYQACEKVGRELLPKLQVYENERRQMVAAIYDRFEPEFPPQFRDATNLFLSQAKSVQETIAIKADAIAAVIKVYEMATAVANAPKVTPDPKIGHDPRYN